MDSFAFLARQQVQGDGYQFSLLSQTFCFRLWHAHRKSVLCAVLLFWHKMIPVSATSSNLRHYQAMVIKKSIKNKKNITVNCNTVANKTRH